jgi:hypothetical protein
MVYPLAARVMLRSENVATPPTGVTLIVPVSIPPAELAARVSVMVPVNLVTVLPPWSSAATRMLGAILAPAVVVPGWPINASRKADVGGGGGRPPESLSRLQLAPNTASAVSKRGFITASGLA